MRRALILAASALVSAIFLWLALRGVPIADILAGIAEADPLWVGIAYVTVLLGMWARSVRWSRGLLAGRLSGVKAFHILNIGMLINQLPLRAGEVARAALAAREGVPLVTAATSIVVERLIDVVVCVALLAIGIARVQDAPPVIAQISAAFGLAAVVAFIVLIVLARSPTLAHRLTATIESRLAFTRRFRLAARVDEVLAGLEPLTQPRRAAVTLLWTGIGWGFSLVTFYALERSVGVTDVDLFTGALLALALASFSIAIPISIAAIGPFQAAVRVAGDAIGMSVFDATTLGFLFQGINIAGYVTLGVIGLISMGASFRDLQKAR